MSWPFTRTFLDKLNAECRDLKSAEDLLILCHELTTAAYMWKNIRPPIHLRMLLSVNNWNTTFNLLVYRGKTQPIIFCFHLNQRIRSSTSDIPWNGPQWVVQNRPSAILSLNIRRKRSRVVSCLWLLISLFVWISTLLTPISTGILRKSSKSFEKNGNLAWTAEKWPKSTGFSIIV